MAAQLGYAPALGVTPAMQDLYAMLQADEEAASCPMHHLSDDLLARIFGLLDSTQLRVAAGTCRRWAGLLRSRSELWHSVHLALPPKKSRGRDRRQSYTTPPGLDLRRLSAWLLARRGALRRLEVELRYPDALLAVVPQLLCPLGALRELELCGSCSDWPYMEVDWRWLAGLDQLERLELADALPCLADLRPPPGLRELRVDRVGGDPDMEGWDELPLFFTGLTRLQRLTLGTAATYLQQGDEEAAFAPLRACRQLEQLELPDGSLSAVPDALTALTRLTALSFRGCDRLEAFGSLCAHKSDPFAPLAALTTLRRLDFSRCALEELPPHLGGLPQLRTLLLAGNQLATLPPPADPAAVAEAAAAAAARVAAVARGGAAGGRAAAAGSAAPLVALPPDLEHLDLRGNAFKALPAALVAPAVAAHLTHLDLSGCWGLSLAASDWRRLIAALPRLRTLRHSCNLLAAEVRGHGSGARLATAVGGCPQLAVEQWPPPGPGVEQLLCEALLDAGYGGWAPARDGAASPAAGPSGGGGGGGGAGRRARSCGSLSALEAVAAEALLGGSGETDASESD